MQQAKRRGYLICGSDRRQSRKNGDSDGKNGDPESGDDGDDRDKSPGDPFNRRFFRFGDSVFQPRFRPFEVGAAGGFAVDLRVGGARDLIRMRARDSGGGHFFAGFERVHCDNFITARAVARRQTFLRGWRRESTFSNLIYSALAAIRARSYNRRCGKTPRSPRRCGRISEAKEPKCNTCTR